MSSNLRIALLSYRSKPHCGGQGVYVRHLSRGLVELGHHVEVFSGPPYPDGLDPRVVMHQVPSLDLYREPDPFRVPRPSEIRDRIDLLELFTMWTAGFPEPRTFGMRTARILAEHQRDPRTRFDIVHDNQSLGTGLLKIAAAGTPVVATQGTTATCVKQGNRRMSTSPDANIVACGHAVCFGPRGHAFRAWPQSGQGV